MAPSSLTPLQSNTLNVELHEREDYPISANYDYWSTKHSKSIEVRQYVKKIQEEDRKIKD